MAAPILEFDPTAEGTGSPLTITTGDYKLTSFSAPSPPAKFQWASSVDTEGAALAARGHDNRTITIGLDTWSNSALTALQGKLAKLHREGGTLKYTTPGGVSVTFDVLAQDGFEPVFDEKHFSQNVTTVQFSLPCKPYGRGAEVTLSDHVETTLPVLIFTEAAVPGDVEARGRNVVDNDGTIDWWGLYWGLEQDRNYTFTASSGSGALFYEAESRTPLGGATTAVGSSGASGGGSNVVRHSALTPVYQSILSTQATGGGAHLTHVGTFRVLARVQFPSTNNSAVSLAFEYSEGDFRQFTRSAEHFMSQDRSTWFLVDLGLVTIRKALQGTHRWEGRIIAKSAASGNGVDVDWLMLIPTATSGAASAIVRNETPTAYAARDEFDQTAGALTGKTLPVGGTWSGSGDTDDLTVETSGKTAQRTSVSDTGSGRYMLAGTTTYTNIVAQIDFKFSVVPHSGVEAAVLLRYVDASNYLAVRCGSGGITLEALVTASGFIKSYGSIGAVTTTDEWYTLRAYADTAGRIAVWFYPQDRPTALPLIVKQSTHFATGGALASGKIGFLDRNLVATAGTRNYDNFAAFVPVLDAAVFAGQSLELGSDKGVREDSSGAVWSRVSSYVGDYLAVPPSGAEARNVRFIAKPIYHPEEQVAGVWIDDRIDDNSARLHVIPRYLVVPS